MKNHSGFRPGKIQRNQLSWRKEAILSIETRRSQDANRECIVLAPTTVLFFMLTLD